MVGVDLGFAGQAPKDIMTCFAFNGAEFWWWHHMFKYTIWTIRPLVFQEREVLNEKRELERTHEQAL